MSSVPPKSTSAGSSLKGRVAIITGSSRGIGRGIALELGRRGASIVVNYTTSQTAADEVVQELQQLGTSATAVQADVSNLASIEELLGALHQGHRNLQACRHRRQQ